MKRLLVALFALAAIAGSAPLFSGANFAVQTSNPQTASAATDFVAPTVTASVVTDTGFIAQGATYRVYANVSDAGNPASGVATVSADLTSISDGGHAAVPLVAGTYVVAGITYHWASADQTASSPLAEGSKSYTVSATDGASNASAPASFSVTVDNTAPTIGSSAIARTDGVAPGFVRQGDSYFVYANASDGSSAIHDVTANVNAVTTGQTSAGLTTAGGPWTVDGVSYAYRSASLTANASLTDGAKSYTISARDNAANTAGPSSFSVTADSTAPTISGSVIATTAGGTPIDGPGVIRPGGTYRVYAEASDAGVGITSVSANASAETTGQSSVALVFNAAGVTLGGTTYHWISAELTADSGLTAGTKSYSVTAADTLTNSGSQSFSVIADATAPTVSLTTPAGNATVNGTITPSATASDINGIAFVKIQRSPAGAGTWTDICTITGTSPFSCSFDTTAVADGLYDIRAVATDKGGNTAASTSTNVRVSNTQAPIGTLFEATNCTTGVACVAGQANQGDTLIFTYSKAMKASSIIAGWNGLATQTVRVNLNDSGANDTLTEVQLDTGSGTVSLGSVALGQNYVNSGSVAFLTSSITQSGDGTAFTITLGTLCSTTACGGGSTRQITSTNPVKWTPSGSATDTSGIPVDTSVTPTTTFTAF